MMENNLLYVLIGTAVASSAAIVLVGLLRKPLRVAVGAGAAYWLWLLVPASTLSVLLPAPSQVLRMASIALPGYVKTALSGIAIDAAAHGASRSYLAMDLMIWLAGAAFMFSILLARQLRLVRSLGEIILDANGIHRSGQVASPMLVGAWRPQIVVPLDFDTRYSSEEQQLVLAHERAHRERHDIAINAFAAAWLCLAWFNPLMYWALRCLRLDQELACDASVLARSGVAPRPYANALLKTQLTAEPAWRMPAGCHWDSSHSLKERIAMLKHPPPGMPRHLAGIVFALALSIAGSYAVWAAQPRATGIGDPILVNLNFTVITSPANSPITDTFNESIETIVNSGETPNYNLGHPYDARCTPYLPDVGPSSVWDDQRARGIPVPAKGQILLECKIRNEHGIVATPSMIEVEGTTAVVAIDDSAHMLHYKLEVNASTSKETIAARKAAAAQRQQSEHPL
jgi:beta-lactamase regulating signal transducer with metallopeptidase domain